MNENKKIAKNTIITYIRLIVATLCGLLYSRFYFRALGAEDYGIYVVVGSVLSMMVFINSIMVTTTNRYIAFEMGKKEDGNVRSVFNTSLVIHILIAIFVLIFASTLGIYYIDNYLNVAKSKMGDVFFIYWTSIASCLINIISVPYHGLITANEEFKTLAHISILNSFLLLLGSIVLPYYMGDRLRLYAIIMAAFSIMMSLQFIVYCYRRYHHHVKLMLPKRLSLYKEMAIFSGWTSIGAASWIGERQGTSLILNFFFGTLVNAAYGIALTVFNMISHFSKAICQSAAPQITKSYSGGNQQRSVDLASYISKYVVFLMLMFSVPILIETKPLINLWMGKDMVPQYTIIMCRLTIINLIINGMAEGLNNLIQATGKIKWFQIVLSSTSLLSLLSAILLFHLGFPPYTIFYCFIAASILNLVVRQILLDKLIDFNVFRLLEISYFRIIYVVLVLIPLFYFASFFVNGSIYHLILSIPIEIIYTLIAIYIVGLNATEKRKISEAIKSKVQSFKTKSVK